MAILYDNEGNQINMSEVAANTSDVSNLKSRMTTAEGDITSLDGRLDTAEPKITALETTSIGLVANKEILGAKNLANIESFTTYRTSRNGLSFINTVADSRALNLSAYYYNENTSMNSEALENTLGIHNIKLTIPANTTKIYIRHVGTDSDLQVGIPWTKAGSYRLCYNIISDDTSTVGGFEISDIMMMLETETDTTYEPYAMSNQELTQKVLDLEARVTALET